MSTLHSSLYAIAIMSCVLCSLVANGGVQPSGRRFAYLGAFLVIESVGFVFEWLMLNPAAPGKSLWLGLLMALSFLLAPCLWLYAREITESSRPTLRSLPPRHTAVIAAGMLLTLPLIQTTHVGLDYANPNHVISEAKRLFVHGTMLAAVVLFLLQAAWYLRASVRILATHTGLKKALFARIESKALNALRILSLVALTHWIVNALRAVHCLSLGKDTGLGVVFAFLQVAATVWAILSLLRSTTVVSFEAAVAAELPANEPKYARSALDRTTRTRIQRKLQEAMAARRLHSDSQLSLRTLCQQIKENPHYVSQVINQDLSTTFHDLVNHHRIEDAKAELTASPDKTVLEIGLQAGFNSKSTFNAVFRQRTGMTPSEYRNQQLAPDQE